MEAAERAVRAQVGDVEVRILAAEDHLALLCVHLLSHGAWRPLWLCDVAAAVEGLPDGFDWDLCLGRSRRLSTWVGATIMLAERLLEAKVDRPPPVRRRVPRWLEPAVLEQWGSPRPLYPGPLVEMPTAEYFKPAQALRVLRAHWVSPIQATMFPGAGFSGLPRLPLQLRFVAWKGGRFVRRLARDARRTARAR